MDRRDFYYRQKVLEGELDAAFDGSEDADRDFAKDLGVRDNSSPAIYGGIMWGFTPTFMSGLLVAIDSGVAYDASGQRCYISSSKTVSVSATGICTIGAGGVATGGESTTPTSGYERIVSIFAVFDRDLDDERYDGYNNRVLFERNESFHFYLSMGAEKVIGGSTPVPPARETDKHLLADVWIENPAGTTKVKGDPTPTVGDDATDHISTYRKEWLLNLTATNSPYKNIIAGRIREAILAMLNLYNDHVAGLEDIHLAEAIAMTDSSAPTKLWADTNGGTYIGSTNVFQAFENILTDLAKTTTTAGAARIGAKAVTGALATPAAAAKSLTVGTLEAQLTELLVAVNGRVFRGGDSGLTGTFAPATNGGGILGASGYCWDAYIRDLYVTGGISLTGTIGSHLIPSADSTYDIGTDSIRWRKAYLDSLDCTGAVTITGAVTLGSGASFSAEDVAACYFDGVIAEDLQVTGMTTLFAGDTHDGFTLRPQISADPTTGGWLARIKSQLVDGSGNDWLRVSKFGDVSPGPFFHDNFQYVTRTPSTVLGTHLPANKWEEITPTYSAYIYEVVGTGDRRCFHMKPDSAIAATAMLAIRTGGSWPIGALYGLHATFTMGVSDVMPNAGEQLTFQLRGDAYGSYVIIRIDSGGAFGMFYNGAALATGVVNLIGGAPTINIPYSFRISVLTSNKVLVQGPSNEEYLIPSSGSINAAEHCRGRFQYLTESGSSSGGGGALYEVWINEQRPRDLD